MRTEPDGDGVRTLSRRAFVVGAGSAVAASTTGTAAGAEDGDLALTVEATAPYRRAVGERADAVEQQGARAPVSVEATDGTPAERVLAGPADVLVTGAPVAGTDGEEREHDLRRAVGVHGWATLAVRRDDWRESLRGRTLRSKATGDRPVETWSESDWESVEVLEGGDEDGDDRCAGRVSTDADRTSLVRGTRAYQYARGRGGVGYYEVAPGDVGAPSATRDRGDDVVPLVRLASLYVDDASLDEPATASFLKSYLGRSPPAASLAADSVPGFAGGATAIRA